MRKFLLCFFLLWTAFLTDDLKAQQIFINEARIEAELERRGLDKEKVAEALLEEGIDINNLDPAGLTAEQVSTIERVILELEQEQIRKAEQDGPESDTLKLKDKLMQDSLELEKEKKEDIVTVPPVEVTIFGQNLFRNNVVGIYDSSNQISAPDNYVLGPGDELIISIWGRSRFDHNHVIGEDGFIDLSNSGQKVYLRGLTMAQARAKLRTVLAESYSFREGEYKLSLNYSRTVRISIYGEVYENPGSYALSAFNSAFNALSLVKGPSDIGSLRNIQLQKSDGRILTLDVYELIKNPAIHNKYFLEENDVILIPVSEVVVQIDGAVKRPLKYELLPGEGIRELLKFSGGFTENAYPEKIQILRFVNGQQKIIDINWREYLESDENFVLENGDRVNVTFLDEEYKNFIEIKGEVVNEGIFERTPGMKVRDAIAKAGLTERSSLEQAYITRTHPTGLTEIIKLDLNELLTVKDSEYNIALQDRDVIEIWSLERFNDMLRIHVSGSVRLPGEFPYDNSESIRVREAILMAGGLSRDASNYAIIHHSDPLNPKIKSYRTIDNLDEIFTDPTAENNYTLNPFDSLVVESKNVFLEEAFVRIEGAVNRPGEYQYGKDMTIKDLLTLAGGFKLAASTNNIEISRVIIRNNQPTRTVVDKLHLDRNFDLENQPGKEYRLEPYDNIAVRFINEFELQKRVFLGGEVEYPGPYAISKINERINSVIQRAGGLTEEAFPAGATLERQDNDYGSVVIKLDQIIKDPTSEFNFVIKNGDYIYVPKIREFVTIRGATRAKEVVGEEAINEGNEIHVPFHQGKDAMFYINEYAGGLDDLADKKKIFVEHANGEIKRPKAGLFQRKYPKILQGSTITVGYKTQEKEEEDEGADVDWTSVLGDSVAQAMSILTLILLIQRLD